ncbi:hypothetical protein CEXT_772921 [Caerostris extrusa]|uniref:Uncharacterized protein n=1 Tax=Caerostris extrusa TaxID=172846 RepID=A0AAV4UBZ4_CAEEX|nr:hypothetical protein CEXT_772921 [Caerostris extrusa]
MYASQNYGSSGGPPNKIKKITFKLSVFSVNRSDMKDQRQCNELLLFLILITGVRNVASAAKRFHKGTPSLSKVLPNLIFQRYVFAPNNTSFSSGERHL